jgi:hypothetical protein
MELKKVAETSRWWSPRDRGVIQASIEETYSSYYASWVVLLPADR